MRERTERPSGPGGPEWKAGFFETTARELAAELSRKAKAQGLAVETDWFYEPGGCVAAFCVYFDSGGGRAFAWELCRSPLLADSDVERAFEALLSEYGSVPEWRVRLTARTSSGRLELRLPGASSAEELRLKDAVKGAP